MPSGLARIDALRVRDYILSPCRATLCAFTVHGQPGACLSWRLVTKESMRSTPSLITLALFALTSAQSLAQSPPIPAARDLPYPGTIRLQVDATDLDHRVFQVRQTLPVGAGALTLYFPRWMPGTHGPTGAVDRLAGLQVHTDTQRELAWRRDAVDPFAFHVDVPQGVNALELRFQHLSPLDAQHGRVVMTREMLNLQWNSVLLYPAGHYDTQIRVTPSLRLPSGWQQASALQVQRESGSVVEYQTVDLGHLVDSPVFAGRHLRRVALDPQGAERPVTLNVVADTAEQLQASEEQLQAHRMLVQQADRLFGARHFERYNFLLSISERMSGIGLEHHESSENGVRPGYFKDWAKRVGARELLPHEYVHSWNGKFRRPADLWTPHFNVPMQGSLLWLYEGQTQFWGRVLAARSGLVTPEQSRDRLAQAAASLDHRAGRTWRNLQDTTNEAAIGDQRGHKDWSNWQRGADYYDEAALFWLDADSLIREKSGGQRSLDDFARLFFGVENGRVQPLTYTFADIVATLGAVQAHDWERFLRERLDSHGPRAPLDGLERAGWRLVYGEKPSEFAHSDDREDRADDYAYSLGLYLKKDGRVDGVLWGSPAYQAGLSKALQLVAVNGQAYKAERLSEAITANKNGRATLVLLLKEGEFYRSVTLDYRGGLRYPRLERIPDTPDRLDAGLLAPRPA